MQSTLNSLHHFLIRHSLLFLIGANAFIPLVASGRTSCQFVRVISLDSTLVTLGRVSGGGVKLPASRLPQNRTPSPDPQASTPVRALRAGSAASSEVQYQCWTPGIPFGGSWDLVSMVTSTLRGAISSYRSIATLIITLYLVILEPIKK